MHPLRINGESIGQAIDLSMEGMYIGTQASFGEGSTVDLNFQLEEASVDVKATVVYAHPGTGMGVRFRNLKMEDAERIKAYLTKISNSRKIRLKDHRKQILIVDDTEFYRRVYQHGLLGAGFSVSLARSGLEGLKIIAQERPDLILLDLVMEGMDGYRVLQILKGDPMLQQIPVIVFTAKGATHEVEKALAMGAIDYLVKAVTRPQQVIDKVKQVLTHRELTKGYL
jgi:CheY-like chemotaxis protein